MQVSEYITSERFIHDDLLVRAQAAVNHLYEIWKKDGKIDPSLLTWPAEAVLSENGEKVDGVCCLQLPEAIEARRLAICKMVERTKAYALLVVEQLDVSVRVILETPNGTRCWNIPVHRSGDVKILGDATVTDNRENVGLLWSHQRAVA
jgi:hypothetical protein